MILLQMMLLLQDEYLAGKIGWHRDAAKALWSLTNIDIHPAY